MKLLNLQSEKLKQIMHQLNLKSIASVLTKVLTITLFSFICPQLMNAQGDSGTYNVNNSMKVISFNKFLPNAKVDKGYYKMEIKNNLVCVQMVDNTKRKRQHFLIENCFSENEINKSSPGVLSVTRSSGELEFHFDSPEEGEFIFRKDPSFVKFLKNSNIDLDNDLYYFKLFLGDIDREYISDIKNIGFNPSITELGRLVWHDASVNYIQNMKALFPDFNLDDISMMSAHNVTIDYLQELKEIGIEDMDLHSIKKARMNNLTAEMIKEQKRKGNNFKDLNSYLRLFKNCTLN